MWRVSFVSVQVSPNIDRISVLGMQRFVDIIDYVDYNNTSISI